MLFAEDGVAAGLKGHSAAKVVDMSSISLWPTKGFRQAHRAVGAQYLDASVSGGEVAPEPPCPSWLAGPDAVFERVKPLFEKMGKNITLVGGNGDGQTAKVANQIIVALNIEAVALRRCCCIRAGADPARAWACWAALLRQDPGGLCRAHRSSVPLIRASASPCIRDLNLALSARASSASRCP